MNSTLTTATATATAAPTATATALPERRAAATLKGGVKAADDDLRHWLTGLVTGEGSSPSQIIVSSILGVVPGLGQAMDLRDLVLGVMQIASSPANPSAWLDMSITLVGCVPVAGDGLKTVFRLVKRGDGLPRILDALSPQMRGNVETWTRNIDWASLASSVKRSFDDVLGAFIDGLDGWLVKSVLGRGELDLLIRQITDLRKQAPQRLDQALSELRLMWTKALATPLPKSTAAHHSPRPASPLPAPAARPAGRPATAPARGKPAKVEKDRTAESTATPDKPRNDERRATRQRDSWSSGVMGEHITDYWCAREKRNLKKANNNGKLWETHGAAGRHGIDHVWVQTGASDRPGVIGETKSSLLGSFRFLGALTPELTHQLDELGAAEAANPTPSGQPNIFHSTGRDDVSPPQMSIGENVEEREKSVVRGLGKSNPQTGLNTQMSHAWIVKAISEERLTPSGIVLRDEILKYWKNRFWGAKPPYDRWILMVTGRQKYLHAKSQGHEHKIQPPVIDLPANIIID